MEKKKNKKELESAFQSIFQKKEKNQEEYKEKEIQIDKNKLKEITDKKDYDRRLTIPLSRLQEKYLEDLIHEIHRRRNRKSQRLTKAAIIRAMINSYYAMEKEMDLEEIENEESLNERFYLFYKNSLS